LWASLCHHWDGNQPLHLIPLWDIILERELNPTLSTQIVRAQPRSLSRIGLDFLPAVITAAGEGASCRFIEFFTANIRNKNTHYWQ
jgi:hypothetical protein